MRTGTPDTDQRPVQTPNFVRNECFLPLSGAKATACQRDSSAPKWGRYIAARSCQLNHHPSPIRSPRSIQQGFTLVELVVTVALVAVLATLAFPDFSEFVRQWRRDSATRALTTSLQLARSEAIKSSRQIMVCPSTNETSCTASSEWNTGWIVFVDDGAGTVSNANNQTYNTNERVLKVASAQSGIASMVSPDVQWLLFLPNGIMRTGAGSGAGAAFNAAATTLTVTPSGATAATKVDRVNVSLVGRLTVVTELP